jgi:hypothetical protein
VAASPADAFHLIARASASHAATPR